MASYDTPKTIDLRADRDIGPQLEGIAGGTVRPGMLVTVNANDQVIAHNVDGGGGRMTIAIENVWAGRGIDDNYASGERVFMRSFGDGHRAYMLLATANNAARRAALASNGDGTLRVAAAGDFVVGYAVDALNNTSGAAARLRVDIGPGFTLPAE